MLSRGRVLRGRLSGGVRLGDDELLTANAASESPSGDSAGIKTTIFVIPAKAGIQ